MQKICDAIRKLRRRANLRKRIRAKESSAIFHSRMWLSPRAWTPLRLPLRRRTIIYLSLKKPQWIWVTGQGSTCTRAISATVRKTKWMQGTTRKRRAPTWRAVKSPWCLIAKWTIWNRSLLPLRSRIFYSLKTAIWRITSIKIRVWMMKQSFYEM